jgi:hypothetical protein
MEINLLFLEIIDDSTFVDSHSAVYHPLSERRRYSVQEIIYTKVTQCILCKNVLPLTFQSIVNLDDVIKQDAGTLRPLSGKFW